MSNREDRKDAAEKIEIQMTPMIDVTFLLLVFFLCTIKFKLLDGKLCTYLPKDAGVSVQPLQEELLRAEISMIRNDGKPLGFSLYLNRKEMNSLEELCRTLEIYARACPDLQVLCSPTQGILCNHVVQVMDECLKAGVTRISFRPAE